VEGTYGGGFGVEMVGCWFEHLATYEHYVCMVIHIFVLSQHLLPSKHVRCGDLRMLPRTRSNKPEDI
jgi:hypothetical protein